MTHAQRQVSITLVLRSRGDDSTVAKIQPVKTADLRGKQATPPDKRTERAYRPAAPVIKYVQVQPPEPKKVTIIRRTAKSEEQLPGDTTGVKQ